MPASAPVTPRQFGQAVKAEARRLGFMLAGVTTPEPPPHGEVFLHWLSAGRQGEMAYLDTERSRERRLDPLKILPECRSILVLGMPYAVPDPTVTVMAGSGRVAAYAWGDDYHDVLAERLDALGGFIDRLAGYPVAQRGYTDTGPILERDLAQRAGLGWIGKNTCLIHPKTGSYFFLAELLVAAELEPDPPFVTDHCGTCTRCLEACPTGCILPDRTIDARRCISYLTIELKGAIPLDLRWQVGEWVFGCDICQQVCPWNQRFAHSQPDPAFAPRAGVAAPDLIAALALSPEAFNRQFKGSPVRRARRRGYLRNAAVALGNSQDPDVQAEAVPALAQALKTDSEPLVRGHAAWALGRIGSELAVNALQSALAVEDDAEVCREIALALEGAA
jgi:epoxyqueuosine reductase